LADSKKVELKKKKSSAYKRHKQSEVRRLQNKSAKSTVRTSIRKFVTLARKKDIDSSGIVESEAALRDMVKKLDTASRKGIINRNAAARKKSRMQKLFNSLKKAQ
jgi:small subunit ribosomal protein S20